MDKLNLSTTADKKCTSPKKHKSQIMCIQYGSIHFYSPLPEP